MAASGEATPAAQRQDAEDDANKENVLAAGILGLLAPAVQQIDAKVTDVR